MKTPYASSFRRCITGPLILLGSLALAAPLAASTGGYASGTGSSAAATDVYTLSDLQTAFNNHATHIVVHGNIYGGSIPYTFTFADTGWNNTTIEGASGGGAVLQNIQLKFDGELLATGLNIQHIVVKNITFYGNIAGLQSLGSGDTDVTASGQHRGINYLAVSFRRCSDVWVDHCTMYNTSDDLWCVNLASDNVTVSWCHFYFSTSWLDMNPNPLWNWVGSYQDLASERIAAVVGANKSDSYTYGTHALHVTVHHCWFGPLMKGRPLNRGYVHYYNNFFDNSWSGSGQYNALQIGSGSEVFSESNYFYMTYNSNQIGLDNSGDAYTFCERNNTYNQTGGSSVTGAAWPSPSPVTYSYTPEATGNVPNDVETNAGPH